MFYSISQVSDNLFATLTKESTGSKLSNETAVNYSKALFTFLLF